MHVAEDSNKAQLYRLGVGDPLHQAILLEQLPCGIERPADVVRDRTDVSVNAPRALLVVEWKAKAAVLREVEMRRPREGGAA